MDSFSIASQGLLYIAVSSDFDNVPFSWRVPGALDSYVALAEGGELIDIQASLDGSVVFAITAKSTIPSYDTDLEPSMIRSRLNIPASRGVPYDDSTGLLCATASKRNAAYQYTQDDGHWSMRVLVAGEPIDEALDTADGLNNPTVVCWYDGCLFIRVFDKMEW